MDSLPNLIAKLPLWLQYFLWGLVFLVAVVQPLIYLKPIWRSVMKLLQLKRGQWPIRVIISSYHVWYEIRPTSKIVYLYISFTMEPRIDPVKVQDLSYIKYTANWVATEEKEFARDTNLRGLILYNKMPSEKMNQNFAITLDNKVNLEWIRLQFIVVASGKECKANLGKLLITQRDTEE